MPQYKITSCLPSYLRDHLYISLSVIPQQLRLYLNVYYKSHPIPYYPISPTSLCHALMASFCSLIPSPKAVQATSRRLSTDSDPSNTLVDISLHLRFTCSKESHQTPRNQYKIQSNAEGGRSGCDGEKL